MDQHETPALTPEQAGAVQSSSFASRATDVFASPSNLYNEVGQASVQTTSWLIPFLVSLILGILFTFSIFNNPALKQQIFDTQAQAMKKSVAEGKMTQEQADQIVERMESSGSTMFIAFGVGGAVLWLSVTYFGVSLVLWLTAKMAFKFTGLYSKMLETFALSSLIGILGGIITLLLVNLMNSLYATPGPALAMVGSFDPTNSVHRLLSALNVFTIWQVVVLGIGFGKVTRSSVSTSVGIVAGLWLVWVLASSFLGLGFR